jgi:DNA-directed RNA polymerases I, II, and III subunit RPABC2
MGASDLSFKYGSSKKKSHEELKGDRRVTTNFITRYEFAQIVGLRAEQIRTGSVLYIPLDPELDKNITPLDIAERELRKKRLPYKFKRTLPSGDYEIWKLSEMMVDYWQCD